MDVHQWCTQGEKLWSYSPPPLTKTREKDKREQKMKKNINKREKKRIEKTRKSGKYKNYINLVNFFLNNKTRNKKFKTKLLYSINNLTDIVNSDNLPSFCPIKRI